MAFKPLPLRVPPGMFRNGTKYESMGRWYDGNMIRWENGRMKPYGGWVSMLAPGSNLTGVARGGIAWSDNNGFRYIAIGTNQKLYVGTAGLYTDVTPGGLIAGRADTISGPGYGSGPYGNLVPAAPSLSSSAAGALGATTYFVTLTYQTPTGEASAGAEASLAVAANHVLVVTSPAASGVATGYNVYVSTTTGTETKQNASPIAIGTNWTEPTSGLVSGASPPVGDTYGTQRGAAASGLTLDAATWSMDTYGQDMLSVLTSDQTIWQFDPTTGLVTKQSVSAPTAIAVMVTNEDFILALGAAGEGRLVQWPDITNPTTWTPAITNTAGNIALNTGGRCMSGTRVGVQNIIWTNMDVHALNFIGTPGIYGPNRLAEGCGLVGPNAYCVTDIAAWMSWGGFKTYNGIVEDLPCDVQDYIWDQVDWTQSAKIYGETNNRYNEYTWWFPSVNPNLPAGTATECDSYVTWNRKLGIWYFGIKSKLGARTTWVDKGVWPLPIAVDPSGVVYEHETGFLDNGNTRVGQIFAVSGPVEPMGGEKRADVSLLIPDVDPDPSVVELTVQCQNAPDGPVQTVGPFSLATNAEGYTPVRFSGRQLSLQFTQEQDEEWSLGTIRAIAKPGSAR